MVVASALVVGPGCGPKRHAVRPLEVRVEGGEPAAVGVPYMALLSGRVPAGAWRCRETRVDSGLVLEGRVEPGPLGAPLVFFAPTALPVGTELRCASVSSATGRSALVALVVRE